MGQQYDAGIKDSDLDSSTCTAAAPPTMIPPPAKVIIFDWDDTICPSSFVDRCQVEQVDDLPTHIQKLFGEIERTAEKCLNAAAKHGEVIIITNSDDGWVKFSCERFVPRLLTIISRFKIVSARTDYEKFYPGQPLCWKAAAFAHEVNELYASTAKKQGPQVQDPSRNSFSSTDSSSSMSDESDLSLESSDVSEDCLPSAGSTNPNTRCRSAFTRKQRQREIISFGDSMEERTAVRIVAEQLSAVPKSVMFVPSPSPTQIIGQLQMLTQHMNYICGNEVSLDLEITSEQALRFAETVLKQRRKYLNDCRLPPNDTTKMIIRRTFSE